ncbi:TPA: inositol monophosphatase family protein [Streptococcus pyogenes]|uniref:inositol monophosphatase family protein n=1 Tax=Streptococcus pyogenes TaxID=1314 RepID=UPI001E31E346|nr:inositol monophosphatase family protein [Streptococcus pyogenes]HER4811192.1 inositol monophosphatase family protein [Streptococcus pyogenes NGAS075]UEN79594.1 inositol monophosphatase family protein [Streptococcus pyogenes]HEQ0375324.1 inositol monophosphatase family protein [Streptococcus pyogenes]HEQ0694453.1 inositol monophosphatase family protein [Streptococcus pyogenes]HEQ0845981.1 inositol monophosphatase family protein [Streptococcus pyogenes]
METKYAFARQIIKEAGLFIKSKMSEQLDIQVKTQFDDLVTNVDQETQQLLMDRIHQTYPCDAILAEENDVRHPINQGNVWVIDPIDGTVNFIVQGSQFAVMIAYYEQGIGQFGLIYDVMADQLLAGGGDFEVTLNGDKLPAYQEKPLELSLIGCNAGMFARNDRNLAHLIAKTLGVRVYGGAGICMVKVMKQELLAYFSFIQPWDYAAAKVLGDKLGYVLLTIDGYEPDFQTRQKIMFVPKCQLTRIASFLTKDSAVTLEDQ